MTEKTRMADRLPHGGLPLRYADLRIQTLSRFGGKDVQNYLTLSVNGMREGTGGNVSTMVLSTLVKSMAFASKLHADSSSLCNAEDGDNNPSSGDFED